MQIFRQHFLNNYKLIQDPTTHSANDLYSKGHKDDKHQATLSEKLDEPRKQKTFFI